MSLLFVLPSKIIPPPCTQGSRRGERRLRRLGWYLLQKYEIFWNKSALRSKICKKEAKNLEVDEIMLIFATSECRQRARTICFQSKIQAGPF